LKSSLFDKRTADASILKNELYSNEDLVFSDNTKDAKKWLWEFGDGARSNAQNGTYHYLKSGSYIVRLTIDGALKVQFPVTVKDTVVAKADTALTINGPTSGVVNEEVRLEAVGKGTQFEWAFGETGRVDVNGKTALYTFHSPGKFLVQLRSDKSRPVTHIMYITDPSLDTVLVVPGEGERKIVDDIRAHLQAIADGADFNSNYYYVTNRYLCNNEKVTVAIEQDSAKRSTDFYSYCMTLTFGGEISVDQAQLTISANSSCATLLNIKQHSAKTVKK
jgi:PKD repeat protein